ncbi:MAG TPA: hypothetical protein VJN64_15165 [Terriglobales bacterium]|nr:hypothetical protein [Terriglobales bacterium]
MIQINCPACRQPLNGPDPFEALLTLLVHMKAMAGPEHKAELKSLAEEMRNRPEPRCRKTRRQM